MDTKSPSKFEFNLTINVYAQDKFGTFFQLALHTEANPDSPTNIFLNYQDRIQKGEIVFDKVLNALREDFKIEKIIDFDLFENPVDDPDEETDEIFQYTANIEVGYNKELAKKVGDVYSSWIEIE